MNRLSLHLSIYLFTALFVGTDPLWGEELSTEWRRIDERLGEQVTDLVWHDMQWVAVGTGGMVLKSEDGLTWSSQSTPTSNGLRAVSGNESQLIAVGDRGEIIRSTDGSRWERGEPFQYGLRDVIWTGTQFIAVGDYGGIYMSADGVEWSTKLQEGAGQTWAGVAASANVIVAVGRWGDIRRSDDGGETWTDHGFGWGGNTWFHDVMWTGSRFLAVGDRARLYTSSDGRTWTRQEPPANLTFRSNLYTITKSGNTFVATGERILTSRNGLSWTLRSTPSSPVEALAWNGSTFIGLSHEQDVVQSSNGEDWQLGATTSVGSFQKMIKAGSLYVGVGGGGVISTSSNLIFWTTRSSGTAQQLNDVSFNGEQFVVVGNGGIILTSTDGQTWTKKTVDAGGNLNAVVWTGSRWVVGGTGGSLLSSTDGRAWSRNGLRYPDRVLTNGRRWVVNDFTEILTSDDGVNWRTRHDIENGGSGFDREGTFHGLDYQNGSFLAYRSTPNRENSRIAVSTTGTAWIERDTPTIHVFKDAVWMGNQYVAIGDLGYIATSPDRFQWTERDSGPRVLGLKDIAWNGRRVVAVGSSGRVKTSVDGINWEAGSIGHSMDVRDITAMGTTFVGVGGVFAWMSENGMDWTRVNTGVNLFAIVWTGDQLVAGGEDGIVTSPDGATWTKRELPKEGLSVRSIAWNGTSFLATAHGGTVLSSSDGAEWELLLEGTAQSINDIEVAGPRVVAVGNDGAVLTSEDQGQTWRVHQAPVGRDDLHAVTWSGSQYVAVGSGGVVAVSDNGLVWQAVADLDDVYLREVIWDGSHFLATGGRVFRSANGRDWTEVNGGGPVVGLVLLDEDRYLGYLNELSFSNDGLRWGAREEVEPRAPFDYHFGTIVGENLIALAETGEARVRISQSGWIDSDVPNDDRLIEDLASNDSVAIAVGKAGLIMRSLDGVQWSEVEVEGVTSTLTSIVWTGHQFMAGGTLGTILISQDGLNWEKSSIGTTQTIQRLAWNGRNHLAYLGSNLMRVSGDGVNWTDRSNYALSDIEWINGQWIAVGERGTVSISRNGVEWSNQTTPTNNALVGVTWTGSLYVAVGARGTVITSPDAITWTLRHSGVTRTLNAVATDGERIVVVGSGGTLIVSEDGVTWSKETGVGTSGVQDVIWTGAMFYAVGDASRAYSSVDGVNWSPHNAPSSMESVIWDGERLIAVGAQGVMGYSVDNDSLTRVIRHQSRASLAAVASNGDRHVVVGKGGEIFTSDDLVTWTERTNPAGTRLDMVAWNGSRYLAVGRGNTILSSSDGLHWSKLQGTIETSFVDVVGFEGGFAGIGTFGEVYRSLDEGQSWEEGSVARTTLKSVRLSAVTNAGCLLIAVGRSGFLMTSEDGLRWVESNETPPVDLFDVSSQGGQVIAVGREGLVLQALVPEPELSGFELWVQEQGIPVGDRGATDDPNRDGVSNLLAYALRIPAVGRRSSTSVEQRPGVIYENGVLAITIALPAELREGVRYRIERSTSLLSSDWSPIATRSSGQAWNHDDITEVIAGDGQRRVKVRIDAEGATEEFFRVRVDLIE